MASNKLVVSEFDFDSIKQNLKNFLQNQPEFSDYDFEGSGFAVLLDVLAYNTHYLGFNANMLANEMFLDSADIRKNIVSLAKSLGYTPASVRAARANIDITVNDAATTSLTMYKGTNFQSIVDGTSYQFVTNEDITILPEDGVYKFSNVTIYEGTLITFKYTVDSNDTDQRFIIPSLNADTTTLNVRVQNSLTDTTIENYNLVTGLQEITSDSNIYFLQETDTGKFEIYFGDGVLGKKLTDGNIVILDYIVTNKGESNGATSFTLGSTIEGFSDVSIITNSPAQGGSERETKESIRFNAPLHYTAQNRAVTSTDYETIVKNLYPNALSVSAWGGEDDEIPSYGTVKISIKAQSGSTLTEQTKLDIINGLKKYNVASVRPIIVDPETTYVLLNSTIRYNKNNTIKTSSTIKTEVIDNVINYNSNTLQKFDGVFRFSKLSKIIDETDNSIVSNITFIKLKKELEPVLGTSTRYDIYFRNAFYNPHAGHNSEMGGILSSTGFFIEGNNNELFLNDDGYGNVRMFYSNNGVITYVNDRQGIIDYSKGQIILYSLNISSISPVGGAVSDKIQLSVIPNSNDIIPVRNTIIQLDISNSNFTVENDDFASGASDAGVGYNTPSSYHG